VGPKSYVSSDRLAPVLIFGFLFASRMDYEGLHPCRRSARATNAPSPPMTGSCTVFTNRALVTTPPHFSLALALALDRQLHHRPPDWAGWPLGGCCDAVVVRMLVLCDPPLSRLFGSTNGWMPTWATRVLRMPAADA